ALREQAERIEGATRLAEGTHRGGQGGALLRGPEREEGEGGEGGHVVETVNPTYQPPPASQADLDRLTADIHRMQAARAQAGHERDHAEQVRDRAQGQSPHVAQARPNGTETRTATPERPRAVPEHGPANPQHIDTAERDRAAHADQAAQADAAANGLVEQRQTLADRMAAWAAGHHAARQAAVEETTRRLEARGLRVTRRPEH